MNNKEIATLLKDALNDQNSESIWYALRELEKNPSNDYQEGFIDGAKYAIEYLIPLFDGVEDTDIYKDYFPESKEAN
jgi:hypothetical protein